MSPLERHVTQAIGKAQPGAAVDFSVIMQIMSMVLQFIQQCPFGNARRAIRDGALEAKVAAYRAVKASKYDGNPVDLTNALIEQGQQATEDEVDATIASAHALPPLLTSVGAILSVCLLLGSAASAGPFPEQSLSTTYGQPFPIARHDTAPEDLPQLNACAPAVKTSFGSTPNPESGIQNPPVPSLRQQIRDYAAAGGGTVGVRGMTITTHMLRDHGWSSAELAGLSVDELYLLHGMQHAGRINPRHIAGDQTAAESPDDGGYPVRHSGTTASWIVGGVRWTNLGGGPPVEGQVYSGGGRSFVYRNGRMHDAGASRTDSDCAGGRCRLR